MALYEKMVLINEQEYIRLKGFQYHPPQDDNVVDDGDDNGDDGYGGDDDNDRNNQHVERLVEQLENEQQRVRDLYDQLENEQQRVRELHDHIQNLEGVIADNIYRIQELEHIGTQRKKRKIEHETQVQPETVEHSTQAKPTLTRTIVSIHDFPPSKRRTSKVQVRPEQEDVSMQTEELRPILNIRTPPSRSLSPPSVGAEVTIRETPESPPYEYDTDDIPEPVRASTPLQNIDELMTLFEPVVEQYREIADPQAQHVDNIRRDELFVQAEHNLPPDLNPYAEDIDDVERQFRMDLVRNQIEAELIRNPTPLSTIHSETADEDEMEIIREFAQWQR